MWTSVAGYAFGECLLVLGVVVFKTDPSIRSRAIGDLKARCLHWYQLRGRPWF